MEQETNIKVLADRLKRLESQISQLNEIWEDELILRSEENLELSEEVIKEINESRETDPKDLISLEDVEKELL